MITYEQIQKANEGLTGIDVKGKNYILVPSRVKAFRMLYPEGFILTDILSNENGVVLMKTEVGYYDGDRKVVLGTGLAYEKEDSSFINRTSYIENCETSSVGRALGFLALGIDGGGICSAEELTNAVNNQKKEALQYLHTVPAPQDLAEIRNKIDAAIKERTKDMSREEKICFLNTVIVPALRGERNWKTCMNITLLQNLLSVVTVNAA